MEDYIPRKEHEEFTKRIDGDIHALKDEVAKLSGIIRTVDKLSDNIKSMFEEQKRQGERLTAIESRDGEMWRTVCKYVATALVGLAIGYLSKHFGL